VSLLNEGVANTLVLVSQMNRVSLRLFFVRLYGGHRLHTSGFAPMGLPAHQQEINDSQQHHHESIDKEQAISQHENVAEKYGSHLHDSQSRSQSRCLRNQEQNRHHGLEGS
jgi:hypothetical protein